jgi:hypothetical protein
MSEVGGLHYIHERIDRLVRQTALEIGLLRIHTGADPNDTTEQQTHSIQLTHNRFWGSQDVAADDHNQERRNKDE